MDRIYPYYGMLEESGRVVKFVAPNCGYLLFNGNVSIESPIGTYLEDWLEYKFVPCTITIEKYIKEA